MTVLIWNPPIVTSKSPQCAYKVTLFLAFGIISSSYSSSIVKRSVVKEAGVVGCSHMDSGDLKKGELPSVLIRCVSDGTR